MFNEGFVEQGLTPHVIEKKPLAKNMKIVRYFMIFGACLSFTGCASVIVGAASMGEEPGIKVRTAAAAVDLVTMPVQVPIWLDVYTTNRRSRCGPPPARDESAERERRQKESMRRVWRPN